MSKYYTVTYFVKSADGLKFHKMVNERITQIQDNGLEAEVHYSCCKYEYSALVLGYYSEKAKQNPMNSVETKSLPTKFALDSLQ